MPQLKQRRVSNSLTHEPLTEAAAERTPFAELLHSILLHGVVEGREDRWYALLGLKQKVLQVEKDCLLTHMVV